MTGEEFSHAYVHQHPADLPGRAVGGQEHGGSPGVPLLPDSAGPLPTPTAGEALLFYRARRSKCRSLNSEMELLPLISTVLSSVDSAKAIASYSKNQSYTSSHLH